MGGSPRRLLAGLLAGALVLAALRPAPAHEPAPVGPRGLPAPSLSAEPSLAVIRAAPDFTLLDVDGRPVRLAALRGRVVLLSFLYTSCPAACPLIAQRMAVLQRWLAERRLLPERVTLLSVTVDPERDSAAVLLNFARAFAAHREGWRFLREGPERLGPVLAAYDEWSKRLPTGEIDHPARLHLIDAAGQVREIYSLALFDERQALLDIQALLGGS